MLRLRRPSQVLLPGLLLLLPLVLLTLLATLIRILRRSVRLSLPVWLTGLLLFPVRRLVFGPAGLAGLSGVNSLLVKDLVDKILLFE